MLPPLRLRSLLWYGFHPWPATQTGWRALCVPVPLASTVGAVVIFTRGHVKPGKEDHRYSGQHRQLVAVAPSPAPRASSALSHKQELCPFTWLIFLCGSHCQLTTCLLACKWIHLTTCLLACKWTHGLLSVPRPLHPRTLTPEWAQEKTRSVGQT